MDQQQISSNTTPVDKETLWYLDNYILLKDYLDRTISRIAARCIRKGNIAMEEYPFYGYILDVLEEISDTGDFILNHKELYPLVEKKIQGGMAAFKKNLGEYRQELKNNSTPDMIKQDVNQDLEKMKQALGAVSKDEDPTAGAGMSMDAVIEKLMAKQNVQPRPDSLTAQDDNMTQPQFAPNPNTTQQAAPRPVTQAPKPSAPATPTPTSQVRQVPPQQAPRPAPTQAPQPKPQAAPRPVQQATIPPIGGEQAPRQNVSQTTAPVTPVNPNQGE